VLLLPQEHTAAFRGLAEREVPELEGGAAAVCTLFLLEQELLEKTQNSCILGFQLVYIR